MRLIAHVLEAESASGVAPEGFPLMITAIGVLVGIAVAVTTLVVIVKSKEIKAPAIGTLAIAAFLLVGSQWTTFKVTESGLEVSRAAEAADEVAAQLEQLADGVEAIKEQVRLLAQRAPSADARSITAELNRTPGPDRQKLAAARKTLGEMARARQ